MNKKTKISIIVATSFVLAGMILFTSVMTILGWDFKKLETAEFETSTYEIGEKFSSISIDSDTTDVVLVPSDNQECKVVCYTEKNIEHTVKVANDTLNINVDDQRKWYEQISVITLSSSKITVYIPSGEYQSLTVNNSTGDVKIPDNFSFKNVNIDVSTGDINCKASVLENVKIDTSTGDVELYNAAAKSIDISTSTGDVILGNVANGGSVSIECDTGDATLNDCGASQISITTDTGDITLNRVVSTNAMTVKSDTGDVNFNSCDAAEFFVTTDTGDVSGTLLSDKIFIISTDTGDIDVPESVSGGKCKITTDTGDVEIKIYK